MSAPVDHSREHPYLDRPEREKYPGEVDPTTCSATAALVRVVTSASGSTTRSEVARFDSIASAEAARDLLAASAARDIQYEIQSVIASFGRRR